jgi:hypothetical protein
MLKSLNPYSSSHFELVPVCISKRIHKIKTPRKTKTLPHKLFPRLSSSEKCDFGTMEMKKKFENFLLFLLTCVILLETLCSVVFRGLRNEQKMVEERGFDFKTTVLSSKEMTETNLGEYVEPEELESILKLER